MASCAETCAACGSVRATAAAAATSAGVVGMTGRVYDALAHDASSTDVSVAVFHCDKRSGAFDDDADSSAASGCSHCALGERGTLHDALGERGANPQGALGALGERGSRLADGIGDRPCVPGERAGAADRRWFPWRISKRCSLWMIAPVLSAWRKGERGCVGSLI